MRSDGAAIHRSIGAAMLGLSLVLSSCGPAAAPSPGAGGPAPSVPDAPRARKTIVAAVALPIPPLGVLGSIGPGAGSINYVEVHSNGLATSDANGRPTPQLARELPSLDRGTMRVLPDGRMTTTWSLRPNATWHDGTAVTARDVVLGFKVNTDPDLPVLDVSATSQMDSVDAVDPSTVLITWKRAYYLADSLGPRVLWPLPAHLLAQEYDAGDKERFRNLPYWTTQYVHAGPFRLQRFDPGVEMAFEAYGNYFLGRPKVDAVVVRAILDRNALFAAVVSGDVDLTIAPLNAEQAYGVKDQWTASGAGRVLLVPGSTTFLGFQFAPDLVNPRELLDPRIRRAFYLALDRPGLTSVVHAGRVEPEMEARSLLPATDPLFSYVRDSYATLAGDPSRAVRAFAEAGWNRGADGFLVNVEGRRLPAEILSEREDVISAASSMWRQVGVESTIRVTPPARSQDREYVQAFPAVDLTGVGDGDKVLSRVHAAFAPTARNGYAGNNRGHYDNPRMNDLIDRYRSTLVEAERGRLIRQIADMIAEETPIMLTYFNPVFATVHGSVHALDDFGGGYVSAGYFGAYTRTSYLWEKS